MLFTAGGGLTEILIFVTYFSLPHLYINNDRSLTVYVLALVNILIAQLKIIPIFFENLTTHKMLLTWSRQLDSIELKGELSALSILYSGSWEVHERSSFTV